MSENPVNPYTGDVFLPKPGTETVRNGAFCTFKQDGFQYVLTRTGAGGDPKQFGIGYLKLFCALNALNDALKDLDVGPETMGPRPVMLVIQNDHFERFKSALIRESEHGADMFKKPKRKKVDPNKQHTMRAGIMICSEFYYETEADYRNLRCPSRS